MLQKLSSYIFLLSLTLLFACSSERETNNDQSFRDYKEFVTQVEQDTAQTIDEIEQDSTWYKRTSVLQARYDSLHNQVNTTLDGLKPEQQEEVANLNTRFEAAKNKITKKHKEISKRYKMREDLLGLKVQKDDLSSISASELAPAYEHFIEKVSHNYKDYSFDEWQLIEGWWNALKNRQQQVSNELTSDARSEITEAENEYLEVRNKAKLRQPAP